MSLPVSHAFQNLCVLCFFCGFLPSLIAVLRYNRGVLWNLLPIQLQPVRFVKNNSFLYRISGTQVQINTSTCTHFRAALAFTRNVRELNRKHGYSGDIGVQNLHIIECLLRCIHTCFYSVGMLHEFNTSPVFDCCLDFRIIKIAHTFKKNFQLFSYNRCYQECRSNLTDTISSRESLPGTVRDCELLLCPTKYCLLFLLRQGGS